MGSMISLSVGRLEIDWGKNSFFHDHSQLFQPCDLAKVPYYYIDEGDPYNEEKDEYNLVAEMKDGLSKPLEQIIDRVNLLGYTMEYARREFEHVSRLSGIDTSEFSFDELAEALATVDVTAISADYGDGESSGKFFRRYLFDRIGLDRHVKDPEYVQSNAGEAMENLSACTVLRLVSQNPQAKSLPVSWHFADLEDEDWATRDQFIRAVYPQNRFLIVTEGSSDAEIIRHALNLLKPHIADFFDFVDMGEGYPFTGTGNLHNFTKGLISISVQNNVVVLYDNDAEGVSSYRRTIALNVPDNMRILKLPDLEVFQNFETVGPSGPNRSDINGRAAAIECYLDVGSKAMVRWNNYRKDLDVYHGKLEKKGEVMKAFLGQSDTDGNYDFTKITEVVDMLVLECTAIRESVRLAELQAT